MYVLPSYLTTCFGLSRPSSGVISYAKTVRMYCAIFIFGVVIHQPHCSPTLLTPAKIVLFKMFLFLFLKLFLSWGVVHLSRLCVVLVYIVAASYCGYVPLVLLFLLRL
jgi:hypothetical protein